MSTAPAKACANGPRSSTSMRECSIAAASSGTPRAVGWSQHLARCSRRREVCSAVCPRGAPEPRPSPGQRPGTRARPPRGLADLAHVDPSPPLDRDDRAAQRGPRPARERAASRPSGAAHRRRGRPIAAPRTALQEARDRRGRIGSARRRLARLELHAPQRAGHAPEPGIDGRGRARARSSPRCQDVGRVDLGAGRRATRRAHDARAPPPEKWNTSATASSMCRRPGGRRRQQAARPTPPARPRSRPAIARCRSMWWLPRSSRLPPPWRASTNHPAGRARPARSSRPTSMPGALAGQRGANAVEQLEAAPLVADGAHHAARAPGRDDRLGVGQRCARSASRGRPGRPRASAARGRPAVVPRRRADPDEVELLRLEHLLPAGRTPSRARAARRSPPPGRRRVAHGGQLASAGRAIAGTWRRAIAAARRRSRAAARRPSAAGSSAPQRAHASVRRTSAGGQTRPHRVAGAPRQREDARSTDRLAVLRSASVGPPATERCTGAPPAPSGRGRSSRRSPRICGRAGSGWPSRDQPWIVAAARRSRIHEPPRRRPTRARAVPADRAGQRLDRRRPAARSARCEVVDGCRARGLPAARRRSEDHVRPATRAEVPRRRARRPLPAERLARPSSSSRRAPPEPTAQTAGLASAAATIASASGQRRAIGFSR